VHRNRRGLAWKKVREMMKGGVGGGTKMALKI
jgi:hypothetical protein